MSFTTLEKYDSQVARATRWAGGALQLLSAGAAVVASIPLNSGAAGTVGAGTSVITFSGFPKTVTPAITGTAIASAQIVDSVGAVREAGLSVGLSGSGAAVILSKLTPASGDSVTVLAPFTLTI